jgi:serine/threonine protein kinase
MAHHILHSRDVLPIISYIFFSFAFPVLEYVEGKMVCDNGLEEATARFFLRDIISGLLYLHSHVSSQFFISITSLS